MTLIEGLQILWQILYLKLKRDGDDQDNDEDGKQLFELIQMHRNLIGEYLRIQHDHKHTEIIQKHNMLKLALSVKGKELERNKLYRNSLQIVLNEKIKEEKNQNHLEYDNVELKQKLENTKDVEQNIEALNANQLDELKGKIDMKLQEIDDTNPRFFENQIHCMICICIGRMW